MLIIFFILYFCRIIKSSRVSSNFKIYIFFNMNFMATYQFLLSLKGAVQYWQVVY